jgi:hypothetical protein
VGKVAEIIWSQCFSFSLSASLHPMLQTHSFIYNRHYTNNSVVKLNTSPTTTPPHPPHDCKGRYSRVSEGRAATSTDIPTSLRNLISTQKRKSYHKLRTRRGIFSSTFLDFCTRATRSLQLNRGEKYKQLGSEISNFSISAQMGQKYCVLECSPFYSRTFLRNHSPAEPKSRLRCLPHKGSITSRSLSRLVLDSRPHVCHNATETPTQYHPQRSRSSYAVLLRTLLTGQHVRSHVRYTRNEIIARNVNLSLCTS